MTLSDTIDAYVRENVLETVELAVARVERAKSAYELALREACKHHSLRTVAEHAGVSHARVAQIVGAKSAPVPLNVQKVMESDLAAGISTPEDWTR